MQKYDASEAYTRASRGQSQISTHGSDFPTLATTFFPTIDA